MTHVFAWFNFHFLPVLNILKKLIRLGRQQPKIRGKKVFINVSFTFRHHKKWTDRGEKKKKIEISEIYLYIYIFVHF